MNVTYGETFVASTKSVRYLGVDMDQSSDGNYIAGDFLKKDKSQLKFNMETCKIIKHKFKEIFGISSNLMSF